MQYSAFSPPKIRFVNIRNLTYAKRLVQETLDPRYPEHQTSRKFDTDRLCIMAAAYLFETFAPIVVRSWLTSINRKIATTARPVLVHR